MTAILRQTDSTDRSLRAHGCGAYAAVNALERVSGGKWTARGKAGTVSARFRVRVSGASEAQFNARGLTSSEVYRSLQAVTSTDLMMDVPLKRYQGQKVRDMLARMESVGGALIIAVDYARVQDAGLGIGTFRGGHWVTVYDHIGDEVVVADPLRRQTIRWPVRLLISCAEHFGDRPGSANDNHWGDQRGEAILVYPWRTWRQGYRILSRSLERVTRERDALQVALDECKAQEPPDASGG